VIRRAKSEDILDITVLIEAAYGHYVTRLGRNPQPMDDDYAALIDAGEVWVSEGEVSLNGVLVCQKVEDYLLVRTVGVSPEIQRRGLGSELMMEAKALAKIAGTSMLRLYTNEVMTGNVDLYERLGYSETHRAGPEGKRVVYMKKELN
jgi:ribosomal protein S18 acetylase RimI-like enzyme